jgi:hypothetical protein
MVSPLGAQLWPVQDAPPPTRHPQEALMAKSPKLTAKKRNRLKSSTFALPGKRKYPIDTPGRARNALSRVAQHGTPAEKKAVRAKVKRKYPSIGKKGK